MASNDGGTRGSGFQRLAVGADRSIRRRNGRVPGRSQPNKSKLRGGSICLVRNEDVFPTTRIV